MTEIREYRGKRVDNGEWIFGDLVRYQENQRLFIAYDEAFYMSESCGMKSLQTDRFFEVDPETVGQYTGRNERPFGIKSDKKIYNGDKVCCYGGESCQGYWEYQTEFIVDDMDSDKMVMLDAYDYVDIIGNIHDNPELKGGE